MEIFFGIICVLIGPRLPFLDTALSPDADFCSALSLHLLQTVPTRANEQPKEVDFGEFLDGNVDLFRRTLGALLLLIFDRRTEVGIILQGFVDESDALIFKLLAVAYFTSVGPSTVSVIGGWRRR
jgi:hypothetical protein